MHYGAEPCLMYIQETVQVSGLMRCNHIMLTASLKHVVPCCLICRYQYCGENCCLCVRDQGSTPKMEPAHVNSTLQNEETKTVSYLCVVSDRRTSNLAVNIVRGASAENALQMAAKMAGTKKSSESVIFPWRGKGRVSREGLREWCGRVWREGRECGWRRSGGEVRKSWYVVLKKS